MNKRALRGLCGLAGPRCFPASGLAAKEDVGPRTVLQERAIINVAAVNHSLHFASTCVREGGPAGAPVPRPQPPPIYSGN